LIIGFIGLSHLGLVYAIAAANRGFEVVAYDFEASMVMSLRKEEWPVEEPGLFDAFHIAKSKILFTNSVDDLHNCHIIYVSQDVKTNSQGLSDLKLIEELTSIAVSIKGICQAKVILSQVPLGFTRRIQRQDNIPWFYQVETLVFGEAISRAINPDRIMIGCQRRNQKLVSTLEEYLFAFNCQILPMKYESAELAKMSINAYLAATISTTNQLSQIALQNGADWADIETALRLDNRIGQHAYVKPGLGIGGGNIIRDLETLSKLHNEIDSSVNLFETFSEDTSNRRSSVLNSIREILNSSGEEAKLCIIGLTYKANTNSLKNSLSLEILDEFLGKVTSIFDPFVSLPLSHLMYNLQVSSLEAALESCSAAVIMTPWPYFQDIEWPKVLGGRKLVLIDPWNIVLEDSLPNSVSLVRI
jgi:UDPglucose 6-dehydrogenase